jgi:asparagine synthase (glutamine-hydrolysing)
MCGICGLVYKHGFKPREEILHAMNDAMIHRGPDDEGYWFGDGCGLAMRRLSIIDLSSGHQPISNEDQTVWVVFNGEIYNFLDIRKKLETQGHIFYTKTDTEVLVHLYEEYGIDFVHQLNGMFAIGLWDRRKMRLILVRDRLGIKPLYYSVTSDGLAFGSEIKSLLKNPGQQKILDIVSLNQYLTYEYVPSPRTIYSGIKRLFPGHVLIYENEEINTYQYWRLKYASTSQTPRSEEESMVEIEKLIEDSVKRRTIADVPLGAFLSGGIDSSLITYFLTKVSNQRVQTFNIGFVEKTYDESVYARKVAAFLDTEHHEAILSASSAEEILPEIFGLLDEPFADASLIPTYLLSKYTRQSVKVALSGDGGDELFGGYPTYIAHKLARHFPQIAAKPLQFLANLLPASDENISFDFKVKKFVSGLHYKTPERNQIWLGSFDPDQKSQLLSKVICSLFHKAGRGGIASSTFMPIFHHLEKADTDDYLNRILYQDMFFYLHDNMFFKVDRSSMWNSLEVRIPYMDYRLVELVCPIAGNLKVKGIETKYLLKKIAQKYLPKEITTRKKKGFGMPVAKWLKGSLKSVGEELLHPDRIRKRGLFNDSYVSRIWQEHQRGFFDHRKLLWTLIIFEMWSDTYGFDNIDYR